MNQYADSSRLSKRYDRKPARVQTVSEMLMDYRTRAETTAPDISPARMAYMQCGRMENFIQRIEPCSPVSIEFLTKEANATIQRLSDYIAHINATTEGI